MGLAVAVAVAPLIAAALPRAEDIGRSAHLYNSFQHRLVIWHFTVDRIAEHPWFGWGTEASRDIPGGEDEAEVVIQAEPPERHHYQYLPLHPHDAPLQAWLELGVPGGILLAALAWVVMAAIAQPLATGAVVAAAVVGGAGYGMWQSWWQATLWLTALLFAAAAPRIDPQ
jgi:O-antigen ligase